MASFGIDISKWQGDFNMTQAKSEGVEFAIIKVGGGDNSLYGDKRFEENVSKCIDNHIPFGCYFYGNAKTVKQAEDEANFCLFLLEDYHFDLPVFYDVEGSMVNNDRNTLTQVVKTFCSIIKRNGFLAGIYASESVYNNSFNDNELSEFYHWVAKWSTHEPKLNSGNAIDLWQFGGESNLIRTNKVAGVVCDQDYCYMALSTPASPPSKSVDELAQEVINGLWGNGEERKQRLTDAGYDYQTVQNRVNELYDKPNKKSNDEIALEVYRGEWGNGTHRRQALIDAGYDPDVIQQIVNNTYYK